MTWPYMTAAAAALLGPLESKAVSVLEAFIKAAVVLQSLPYFPPFISEAARGK